MANPVSHTTTQDLHNVIDNTVTRTRPFLAVHGLLCVWTNVILVSLSAVAANNKAYLKKMGITHVVNTAEGTGFTMVDIDKAFYADVGIRYLGFRLLDLPTTKIDQYFETAAQFIDDALKNGGKVLVNCFMGLSRSATVACAFLMLRRNMGAVAAMTELCKNRPIQPNDGFLSQLAHLDNRLRAE